MPARATRNIGSIVYLLGVLGTLTLAAFSAWAAFEGLSYFATGAGYEGFDGLHCPVLISPAESGVVQADFVNGTDEAQQPYYEVEISGRVAARKLENQITVLPHATQQVSWTVSTSDVDLQPFIFVKIDVLPMDGYGTREATCGILVADAAGMQGATAMAIWVALSLLGLLVGLVIPVLGLPKPEAMRFDSEAGSNSRRAAQALGVSASAALFAGLMGWWLAATLLLAVSLLLLVMVLPGLLSGR